MSRELLTEVGQMSRRCAWKWPGGRARRRRPHSGRRCRGKASSSMMHSVAISPWACAPHAGRLPRTACVAGARVSRRTTFRSISLSTRSRNDARSATHLRLPRRTGSAHECARHAAAPKSSKGGRGRTRLTCRCDTTAWHGATTNHRGPWMTGSRARQGHQGRSSLKPDLRRTAIRISCPCPLQNVAMSTRCEYARDDHAVSGAD